MSITNRTSPTPARCVEGIFVFINCMQCNRSRIYKNLWNISPTHYAFHNLIIGLKLGMSRHAHPCKLHKLQYMQIMKWTKKNHKNKKKYLSNCDVTGADGRRYWQWVIQKWMPKTTHCAIFDWSGRSFFCCIITNPWRSCNQQRRI